MTESAEVPARPASTVLLVRDGATGLEVFMVVRNNAIAFAGGALVFPGGRVESDDAVVAGGEGLDAYRIAGIRETFEECGILLARPARSQALIGADALLHVERRWRVAVAKGEERLSALLAAEKLAPATDTMLHFAHWITPRGRPKRFDTQFFLAAAPPDQLAAHDGTESVDSVWINPQAALAEADAGKRDLVFATRMNLAKLARSGTVAEALAATRANRVVTVEPEMLRAGSTRLLKIPAEADYGGELFETTDKPAN